MVRYGILESGGYLVLGSLRVGSVGVVGFGEWIDRSFVYTNDS